VASEPVDPPPAARLLASWRTCAWLALALAVLVRALDLGLAPGPEEPLGLRWARVAASHPLRTAAAGLLLARALLPGRARRCATPTVPEAARGR
jgi:hypothetical protein